MSQPQRAGPVAERAGYGAGYVAYLRSIGHLKEDVQAYCTMRSTAAEIERSRLRLSQELCPECGGIERFESVAWPRGGQPVDMGPAPVTKVAAREIPTVTQAPSRKASDPLLVIMGNSETGKLIKVSNQLDLVARANAQALAVRPTGWETLLVTSTPGFGTAFCVEDKGVTHFFVAHGLPTQKESIAEARKKAKAFATKNGGVEKVCGAPWRASEGIAEPRESGAIDVVKDIVRDFVTCDPDLPRVSESGLNREKADPGIPQVEHEKLKARGRDGRKPCVDGTLGQMGVRG